MELDRAKLIAAGAVVGGAAVAAFVSCRVGSHADAVSRTGSEPPHLATATQVGWPAAHTCRQSNRHHSSAWSMCCAARLVAANLHEPGKSFRAICARLVPMALPTMPHSPARLSNIPISIMMG